MQVWTWLIHGFVPLIAGSNAEPGVVRKFNQACEPSEGITWSSPFFGPLKAFHLESMAFGHGSKRKPVGTAGFVQFRFTHSFFFKAPLFDPPPFQEIEFV